MNLKLRSNSLDGKNLKILCFFFFFVIFFKHHKNHTWQETSSVERLIGLFSLLLPSFRKPFLITVNVYLISDNIYLSFLMKHIYVFPSFRYLWLLIMCSVFLYIWIFHSPDHFRYTVVPNTFFLKAKINVNEYKKFETLLTFLELAKTN